MNIGTQRHAHEVLGALEQQLSALGASFELVVIGGSALLALELATRPTRDVDVVALRSGGEAVPARPLPEPLQRAAARVARDLDLPPDWLNDGPADLLDFGLPSGFLERAARQSYGPGLTVWWASRHDQIHLKLFAMVDQGPGKHEADLRALSPTPEELRAAAHWSRTHDPSEGYQTQLDQALRALGVGNGSGHP